jgi:hypothetical protein
MTASQSRARRGLRARSSLLELPAASAAGLFPAAVASPEAIPPATRPPRRNGRGLPCGAALALALMAASPAGAHSSPQGWRYGGTCCSSVEPRSHQGDCAPIPDSAVEEIPGGYRVTVRPGDHPLVTREHTWDVPFDRPMAPGSAQPAVRPSGDSNWHICLHPNEDTLRCLYFRLGGV